MPSVPDRELLDAAALVGHLVPSGSVYAWLAEHRGEVRVAAVGRVSGPLRFQSFYCIPGQVGAHEKGGVEGDGGRFRRNQLVPVPPVGSLVELNAALVEADAGDDARHIDGRSATVGAAFAAEAPYLLPLPAERFDTALSLSTRVDRYARVTVRQCLYSVPATLIGARVRVALGAEVLQVFDGSALVATHRRLTTRGAQHLVLDHYLEVLAGKPGALPGSTALAQARAAGVFTATHEAFWQAARAKHGDATGTRALIEVLLLHRRLDQAAVLSYWSSGSSRKARWRLNGSTARKSRRSRVSRVSVS